MQSKLINTHKVYRLVRYGSSIDPAQNFEKYKWCLHELIQLTNSSIAILLFMHHHRHHHHHHHHILFTLGFLE